MTSPSQPALITLSKEEVAARTRELLETHRLAESIQDDITAISETLKEKKENHRELLATAGAIAKELREFSESEGE